MYKYIFIIITTLMLLLQQSSLSSTEIKTSKMPGISVEQLDSEYNAKFFDFTDNTYAHVVAEVKDNGHILVLEDGSEWNIGRWWKGKVKQWQPGDIIHVSYHVDDLTVLFNYIKFSNATAKQTIWGSPKYGSGPRYDNPNTLWVDKIEHGALLKLNDGGSFEPKFLETISNWQEGNIVFILSNENDKEWPYSLWNFSRGWIVYHFKLVQGPEIFARPCD